MWLRESPPYPENTQSTKNNLSALQESIGLPSILVVSPEVWQSTIGVMETQEGWVCNFWNMVIGGSEYFVTALHCIEKRPKLDTIDPDTAIIPYNRQSIKNTLPFREVSRETASTILGKPLTLNIYIPWNSGKWATYFSVQWNASAYQGNPELIVIRIKSSEYKKMIFSEYELGGASGGVVLDSEGKIFWVLSSTPRYNPQNEYTWIRISPVRDRAGNIRITK